VPKGVFGTWDRLAVEQILDNLISNALKFGAGKPIDISLATDGSGVRLTIRDHGDGISPGDQARTFGRFEQEVGKRQHGGFGIGLWLAHRLVGAMGGEITIESPADGGTAFLVRLPWHMAGAKQKDQA
jgi:signal transduction histidine kinase